MEVSCYPATKGGAQIIQVMDDHDIAEPMVSGIHRSQKAQSFLWESDGTDTDSTCLEGMHVSTILQFNESMSDFTNGT